MTQINGKGHDPNDAGTLTRYPVYVYPDASGALRSTNAATKMDIEQSEKLPRA